MSRTAELGTEFQMHPRAELKKLRRAWLHYNARYGQIRHPADLGVFSHVQSERRDITRRRGSSPIDLDSTRQLQRGLTAGSDVVKILQRLTE